MSDLVERAAKHVAALNGHSDDWECFLEEAEDYVHFVRDDVLEEAAKWFDEQGYVAGAKDLRFLKEKGDD